MLIRSFIILALALTGCATPETGPGLQTSVTYVGDRAAVSFNEMIAAVQVEGDREPYQNLRVELAAVINPRKSAVFELYKVEGLIRRIEPRISAELLKSLVGSQIALRRLAELRDQIQRQANEVLRPILGQWADASDYDIEIVVVSLYLTDGSVGRGQARVRWW